MLMHIKKRTFHREVILINKHRNTVPFINNINRSNFLFIDINLLIKPTRIFGKKTELRFFVLKLILNILKPKYILDFNWISIHNQFFLKWCKENRPSRFVVVQHGLYVGGVITDFSHRFPMCDLFLCWGDHTINELKKYNTNFIADILKWGNPIYNLYERKNFDYKLERNGTVLIAPSLVSGYRKIMFEELVKKLKSLGFQVEIKQHAFQSIKSNSLIDCSLSDVSAFEILMNQKFDIVFTDVSTLLVDSIFFKNNTLFFSPPDGLKEFVDNGYSCFLKNNFFYFTDWGSMDEVYSCINLIKQEELFEQFVYLGSNDLTLLSAPF